ncbi:hypothetical protein FQR65_LT06198 [Abscondita terminalis]|nr:hypothetical protein FQR65_LT06198 [Abscondita terminalis]
MHYAPLVGDPPPARDSERRISTYYHTLHFGSTTIQSAASTSFAAENMSSPKTKYTEPTLINKPRKRAAAAAKHDRNVMQYLQHLDQSHYRRDASETTLRHERDTKLLFSDRVHSEELRLYICQASNRLTGNKRDRNDQHSRRKHTVSRDIT